MRPETRVASYHVASRAASSPSPEVSLAASCPDERGHEAWKETDHEA